MNLFAAIGYDHFDVYGADSSYAYDGTHHASPQHWNDDEEVFPVQANGRMFLTTHWMVHQVQQLLDQVKDKRFDYTVDVKGPGLMAAHLDEHTLEMVYDLNSAPSSYDFISVDV